METLNYDEQKISADKHRGSKMSTKGVYICLF